MSTNKNTLLIATAFSVGIVLGAGLWAYVGSGNKLVNNNGNGVNIEKDALKQAVRQQYPEYFDSGIEGSYSGVVEDVKENSIAIKRYVPEALLLASDIKEIVEISVDENTKIIKNTEKDETVFAVELAAYEAAFAEYQRRVEALPAEAAAELTFDIAEPVYPSSVRQQEISLSDIKPGSSVFVDSQQGMSEGLDDSTMTIITIQESLDMDMGEEI